MTELEQKITILGLDVPYDTLIDSDDNLLVDEEGYYLLPVTSRLLKTSDEEILKTMNGQKIKLKI